MPAPRTLASQIVHRESSAFVGRTRELLIADTLFGPDAPASVLLVHGRGGIGKSVLLREIRRRGVAAGWTPFEVDARDLAPVPDAIEAALEGAWAAARPLVLLDTYERMRALGGYLRTRLLPSLPAGAVIVIAGREAPEAGWFEGGWETVALELELAPLSERESLALLARQDCGERAEAIARWSGGLPLALRLGAAAARADAEWRPGEPAAPLRRLPEAVLAGPHADVFALACIARVVTPALLADVLPDVDADEALRWLAGCAFADTRAGGVTLHELVRRPYRGELWERAAELRARAATSLHARAELIDLADLVQDPAVRSGFGWDGSVDHHVTGPQPGDDAIVPDATTRAFFERDPGHVLVARDPDGPSLPSSCLAVRVAGAGVGVVDRRGAGRAGADRAVAAEQLRRLHPHDRPRAAPCRRASGVGGRRGSGRSRTPRYRPAAASPPPGAARRGPGRAAPRARRAPCFRLGAGAIPAAVQPVGSPLARRAAAVRSAPGSFQPRCTRRAS